jgi:hypothetical protein
MDTIHSYWRAWRVLFRQWLSFSVYYCRVLSSTPHPDPASVRYGLESDQFMSDAEGELADKYASLKPDKRRKVDSTLPPSSHESPSLLYDPLARFEIMHNIFLGKR